MPKNFVVLEATNDKGGNCIECGVRYHWKNMQSIWISTDDSNVRAREGTFRELQDINGAEGDRQGHWQHLCPECYAKAHDSDVQEAHRHIKQGLKSVKKSAERAVNYQKTQEAINNEWEFLAVPLKMHMEQREAK